MNDLWRKERKEEEEGQRLEAGEMDIEARYPAGPARGRALEEFHLRQAFERKMQELDVAQHQAETAEESREISGEMAIARQEFQLDLAALDRKYADQ